MRSRQQNLAMHVRHVKRNQQEKTHHRRPPVKKPRAISAVTSVGSFEEPIDSNKDSSCNNNDSLRSETKTNRPPTITSVVQIHQSQLLANPQDHQQTIQNSTQPVPYPCRQKPNCSKILSEQISKISTSSLAQVHPSQTSSASGDFDPINTGPPSRTSFKNRTNSFLIKQPRSDPSVFQKTEDNNRQQSYFTDRPKNKRRRRCCVGVCPCCSPCWFLLTGLLLSLILGILATIIVLTTSSRHTTTKTTSTTTTSITTSTTTTTTPATTVTITSNTCTSTWNSVSLYNFCVNCSDIDPYQQYAYMYVAIATQTRITFAIREDTGYFALDDVSVRSTSAPTVELLTNGGFETGNLSSWIYCNPAGSIYPGTIEETSSNFSYQGHTYAGYGSNYYYLDGAVGQADYLSQIVATTIGQTYNISFWLYNYGSGTNSNVNVIISI